MDHWYWPTCGAPWYAVNGEKQAPNLAVSPKIVEDIPEKPINQNLN